MVLARVSLNLSVYSFAFRLAPLVISSADILAVLLTASDTPATCTSPLLAVASLVPSVPPFVPPDTPAVLSPVFPAVLPTVSLP